jgi:SAM-dependent methyltransferase
MNLKGAKPERFGGIASFLYRRWAEPVLAPLHRRVGAEIPIESGRLLDVGCGPGRLDRLLAAANPDLTVVGLDASADMLRQARQGPDLPNLEFREGAVESLDSSGDFDFAVSLLSFHHWEEPQRGLEAVHRALKPGGRFWIYEGDTDATAEELRRDQAPLWGWLRVPVAIQRRMNRNHGFAEEEAERVVRPVLEASPFHAVAVSRTGSTIRFELEK